jgi:hypothetical protein
MRRRGKSRQERKSWGLQPIVDYTVSYDRCHAFRLGASNDDDVRVATFADAQPALYS